ncbi:hypothetical protein [Pseudorhodoferax sp. Leaf274]|uniref:hypothetical protein n=1 Tax=Pseudorhodoferax sp. Leaf274 TaxID=1736318 RepID=UPI001F1EE1DA|nr:hypothetical protein [Pseudorhodoferax sp. Leaf274]
MSTSVVVLEKPLPKVPLNVAEMILPPVEKLNWPTFRLSGQDDHTLSGLLKSASVLVTTPACATTAPAASNPAAASFFILEKRINTPSR